jgi:beta-lactamase class A
MRRRDFTAGLGLSIIGLPACTMGQKIEGDAASRFQAIEAEANGRLGAAVLDTATGELAGWRLDERFPMCSTFKWLLAAAVLQRVEAGRERLARRIAYGPDALLEYAPATSKHVGEGMTVGELCEAAVTLSDNTAANLLLAQLGGPEAVTRCARSLGDETTRLDRTEPALNESAPGDPRDTTTPRAMAATLRRAVVDRGLADASREQLAAWLTATRTGAARLRAGLPADWRLGHKTGTGERGSTGDVGVAWPPGRAPLVVVAYLADCAAPAAQREAALAGVGHAVATLFGPGPAKAL